MSVRMDAETRRNLEAAARLAAALDGSGAPAIAVRPGAGESLHPDMAYPLYATAAAQFEAARKGHATHRFAGDMNRAERRRVLSIERKASRKGRS